MRSVGKIKFQYLTAFLFYLLGGITMSAQEIRLSLSKDTIGFNETVVLTLSGESTTDISYVGNPKVEGVSIISMFDNPVFDVNSGKIKLQRIYTLSPYRIGTFSIGPAWVQVGSRRKYSNKISLVILPVGQSAVLGDVFLRCDPDKKKVVLGEQIILSLDLYFRVKFTPNEDMNPVSDPFNGFYYYEGKITPKLSDSIVNVKGLLYHVVPIYQEFVFPNRTGELFIPSYKYVCSIMQNPFPTGDDVVDQAMGMPTDIELVSPPVPIEVTDVPEKNKPSDFKGDVGEFSLNSSIDHSSVKANEPVTLSVTITGKGNIDFIQFPDTKFPDNIESYPPVSTDTITQTWTGITGEKKFRITLIPKSAGNFTIPGISFSYYDSGKKKFVTLKTPEFQINVGQPDSSKQVSENNLPDSFLDTKSYGKIIFRICIIAIPPVLLILFLILLSRKKKRKKEAEEILLKKQEEVEQDFIITKKTSDIQGMINAAEYLITNGKAKQGISQLYDALYTAICEKTELTPEDASVNQMRFRLEIKHFSKEFTSETLNLLQELSELRYSSSPLNTVKLAENLQNTRKLALRLA